MRLVLVLCCTLAAVWAFAEPTFKLVLPEKSGYGYWVADTGSTAEPKPVKATSNEVEVMVSGDPNRLSVFVVNESKGLVASIGAVQAIKAKLWKPAPQEFNRILVFIVEVRPNKGTLDNGSVTVKSKAGEQRQILDAGSKNKATFFLVPNEKATVTLDYKFDGKTVTDSTEGVDPATGWTRIDVEHEFSEPATAGSGPGPAAGEKPRHEGQNPLFSFLRLLVGLAVVGALGYAGYWYYKNNQKVVEGVLAKAGIDPATQGSDPTGALPPEPVQRELKKIDLGTDASVVAAAPVSGQALVVKNPRLVTDSGEIALLAEGEATVGRESGTIVAADQSVSRNHAVFSRTGETVTLTDTGSTNGTFVNGARIAAPVVLRNGDSVQFGAVRYRYEE